MSRTESGSRSQSSTCRSTNHLVDIGHQTVGQVREQVIAAAGTVFVNGPAGIFEKPETEYGTKSIWEAMAA